MAEMDGVTICYCCPPELRGRCDGLGWKDDRWRPSSQLWFTISFIEHAIFKEFYPESEIPMYWDLEVFGETRGDAQTFVFGEPGDDARIFMKYDGPKGKFVYQLDSNTTASNQFLIMGRWPD